MKKPSVAVMISQTTLVAAMIFVVFIIYIQESHGSCAEFCPYDKTRSDYSEKGFKILNLNPSYLVDTPIILEFQRLTTDSCTDHHVKIIDVLNEEYVLNFRKFIGECNNVKLDAETTYSVRIPTEGTLTIDKPGKYEVIVDSGDGHVIQPFNVVESWMPLKQFRLGTSIENITCNENFVLIQKSSNGFPACVSPETKARLIERGWASN